MRFVMTLYLLLLGPVAEAAVPNGQLMVAVTGSKQLSDRADVGLWVSGLGPLGHSSLNLYYVGPGYLINDWWWSSARVGVAYNWPTHGTWSPIFSWWNAFKIVDGRVETFTITEFYPRFDGSVDYYGFYQIEHPIDVIGLGAQAEQVNLGVTAGPRVSLRFNDHLSTNLQHHWDFDAAHTIRAVVVVRFD